MLLARDVIRVKGSGDSDMVPPKRMVQLNLRCVWDLIQVGAFLISKHAVGHAGLQQETEKTRPLLCSVRFFYEQRAVLVKALFYVRNGPADLCH